MPGCWLLLLAGLGAGQGAGQGDVGWIEVRAEAGAARQTEEVQALVVRLLGPRAAEFSVTVEPELGVASVTRSLAYS